MSKRSQVRELIKESVQPYICESCGIGSTNTGIVVDKSKYPPRNKLICLNCGAEKVMSVDSEPERDGI